jgi:hypothetical protein
MIITTGSLHSGKIKIDDATLPEGTKVAVLAHDSEETFELDAEYEAALLAAIAEAERGENVGGAAVLQKIRRR